MKTAELIKEMIQLSRLFYDMVHPGTEHSSESISANEPTDTLLSSWVNKKVFDVDTDIHFACKFLKEFSSQLQEMLTPKSIFEVIDLENNDSDEETPDLYWPFILSMRKFFNWSGKTKQPEINCKQDKNRENDIKGKKEESSMKIDTFSSMDLSETNTGDYSHSDLYKFLEQNPDIAKFLDKNLNNLTKTQDIYCKDFIKKEQSEIIRAILKIQNLFDIRQKISDLLASDLSEHFDESVDVKQARENLEGQFCTITSKLEDNMVQFLRFINEWSLSDLEELETLEEQDHYLYLLNRYNSIILGGFFAFSKEDNTRFELERKNNIEAISQHFEKHVYQSSKQVSNSNSKLQSVSLKSEGDTSLTLIISKKRVFSEISDKGLPENIPNKPAPENAMSDVAKEIDSQVSPDTERAQKRPRKD